MLSPSHHLPVPPPLLLLVVLLLLLPLPAAAQGKRGGSISSSTSRSSSTSSSKRAATAALRLLERGDTRSALALLRKAIHNAENGGDPESDGNTMHTENAAHAAQLQAALGVAALDQNFYAEAERAARRAVQLAAAQQGHIARIGRDIALDNIARIKRAAHPVRGAALLGLGRFKAAAQVLSKLVRTGAGRFSLDMHSVRLYARAKGEGLGAHRKVAKVLLKYCAARFSAKRKKKRKKRREEGHRDTAAAADAFGCFEAVGAAFTRAGDAARAAAAFDMALDVPGAKHRRFARALRRARFGFPRRRAVWSKCLMRRK